MLHTYNDGSVLKIMTSRELISIPIWKGQRILDTEHAAAIKTEVGSNVSSLDSGYSIVKYKEENADGKVIISSYLIDGQHRASVIRDFYASTICEADFNVTVTEKTVESETEAIEYFNKINNVKAQQWKMDTNLIINNYIAAVEKAFNTNPKSPLIRSYRTRRPYLSAESLREALIKNKDLLKSNKCDIIKFVDRITSFNSATIKKFELDLTEEKAKDAEIKETSINVKFALAYDIKLKWVREALL